MNSVRVTTIVNLHSRTVAEGAFDEPVDIAPGSVVILHSGEPNTEGDFVTRLAREIHHQQHGPRAWHKLSNVGRAHYVDRLVQAIGEARF